MTINQNYLSDPKLDQFRHYLAKPGPWSAHFHRLASDLAALNEPVASQPSTNRDSVLTCEICQELLDVYVDDEQAGIDAQQTYPAVWQHLISCEDCQEVYKFLSEVLTPSEALLVVPSLTKVPKPASAQPEMSWTTHLRQSMTGEPFRLEFFFNLSYLRTLFFPQPLALRRESSLQPTKHILVLTSVEVGEQTLIVEVTATRKGPDTLQLQALINSTGPLPSGLRAVLSWMDQTRSVVVNNQGAADLGKVPLASLRSQDGSFGIALVSG